MKYPDTQGRYFRGGGVWINKASLYLSSLC